MKKLLYLILCASLFSYAFAQDKKEEAKPANKGKWTHSTGAGLTITTGNSETTTVNASHSSTWVKDINKFNITFNGAYGVKESIDTSTGKKHKDEFVNNVNEKAQFNRNFTSDFYWYVSQSAEEDRIANLEYRFTIGPGLGYNLLKKDPFKLDLELGAVYVNEKFKTLKSDDNISGRVAEKFNWKISDTANLWLNTEALLNLDDSDDFRINAELGLDVKINENWLIRSTVLDKYYHKAVKPIEKNDVIFMLSVVFKY